MPTAPVLHKVTPGTCGASWGVLDWHVKRGGHLMPELQTHFVPSRQVPEHAKGQHAQRRHVGNIPGGEL
jgi:hypothetical protein